MALAGLAALMPFAALAGCQAGGTHIHVSGTNEAVVAPASATATAGYAADGTQQVVITATNNNTFEPDVIFARPGTLRVTVSNPSVFPIDLTVPSLNVRSTTIFAGRTAVVTFDIPTPGQYQFQSSFHAHDGMTGTLVVN
jgi:plastocyanin